MESEQGMAWSVERIVHSAWAFSEMMLDRRQVCAVLRCLDISFSQQGLKGKGFKHNNLFFFLFTLGVHFELSVDPHRLCG